MFRITWRLQRTGLIGMSAFGIFYGIVQAAAYNSAAGATAAARLAFGQQMETFGRQYSLLLPLPHGVDTIAGFVQWRVYGALPILFGIWALLSAAGATRGDEERGLIEQWLGAGVSPLRYVGSRFIGFTVAAVIAVALTSGAIDAGAAGAGSALPVSPLLEVSLALVALTLTIYAITTVAAQLTVSRGAAAGLSGLVVGVMFFVNGMSRSVDGLKPVARTISPFSAYDRSQPLSPGGSFDAAATLALFVSAGVLIGLAVWFMRVRDLGAPLIDLRSRRRPYTDRPSPNRLLRVPVLASVYEQRLGVLAWGSGAAFFAFYLASVGRQTVDLIEGSPGFRAYLTAVGHGDPYVALTGFFWFGIALLLLAVFAITQVARWSADDNEGRLEMTLSAPVSRTRVVLERAVALVLRLAIVVALSSTALDLGGAAANIHFDAGSLTVASLVLIPFGLSFAAIGAVLASRAPRATVAVLTTFTFLSYLITQLGPLLQWPDWALKLSVFNLYGTPLTSGVDWTGLWIMTAVTLVGFGMASLLMQRRDVGR
jgi:polyether ionophore transport system permease protein